MKKFISQLLKGALLGLYVASPFAFTSAQADDTEVYFLDGASLALPKPKIMIGLDYSSAMNGGGLLEQLKSALNTLANDPSVNEKVDLGLTLIGKGQGNAGPQASVVYPTIAFNASTSPTFQEVVDSLTLSDTISGNTPTVQGMSEIARYFTGSNPKYDTKLTHSRALFDGRYAGSNDPGCTNAMVVLSRGQINGNEWPGDVASIVPESYCGGECDDSDLVRYMREVLNVQTYSIDPGATGRNAANLDNWAREGGTQEAIDYNENVACEAEGGLCQILRDIIEQVAAQGTSFVQAGVTVSQQNRLNHDNHLYFAQFQADNIARWPGNLKKYKISGGNLVDDPGDLAVNPDTGLFNEVRDPDTNQITTSWSMWSEAADGNQVELGGAAAELDQFLVSNQDPYFPQYQTYQDWTRNLFTDIDSGLVSVKDDTTKSDFLMDAETDEAYQDIKDRTLGYSRKDVAIQLDTPIYDADGVLVAETQYVIEDVARSERLIGDPLHSVPKVVQYNDYDDTTEDKSIVFMGTNLGYLHAININSGGELWSYIPYELLGKMKEFLVDIPIDGDPTKHNYGLDGEIFIAHADSNGNTRVDLGDNPATEAVETAEKALLFIGMRRGGGNYYVLDISTPNEPKYLFKIEGGSTGFETLGQTWSTPLVTNIEDSSQDSGVRTVVIFGGGYDPAVDDVFDQDQDGDAFNGEVTKGNDVYIYDINSKSVIWRLSDKLPTLYTDLSAVPANIRAISLNNDTTVDHLYVSDVEGQIFRLDISEDETNGFAIAGGKIFDANYGVLSEQDKARFYYAPSVAFIPRPNGNSFVAVAVGTGYRAHPLNTTIQDHFFMLRDVGVLQETPTYDLITFKSGETSGDLLDVTNLVNPSNSPDIVEAQEPSDPTATGSNGWYIKMTGLEIDGVNFTGEKVISEARILFGKIVFTSYVPTLDTSKLICSPVVGSGKLYGVNLIDGTSFFDDNTRTIDLISDGIPPMFQLLYTSGANTSGGDEAAFIGLVGNEVIDDAFTEALTKGYDGVIRVNWRKKPDDE
ncbi:pilus assembly protein [Kangiella koreensis]|uniref:Tfp pilus assembly protein tip-associated adhesin PilY1-like protein n=1 Tax=Kangiella koreensis (strain DSM 16069 / JCM 12317 / KCTC 12182 / SW-125) TaxID=523791 RepID=C7RCS7_KANKD|nr:PilC/PilY family type IV pilus protein [Kangiella koreensis]ACV27069.1 Tfp pilus assembly protein tip-associated adhesin PilY1-like protein [Kangiella koreensis DSM 16069]